MRKRKPYYGFVLSVIKDLRAAPLTSVRTTKRHALQEEEIRKSVHMALDVQRRSAQH